MRTPAIVFAAALCTAAVAQEPKADGEPDSHTVSRHDPQLSWSLFRACDGDADDRLSLFEARRTLPELGNRDLTLFRELDLNTDGYLDWSEFDARYRTVVHRRGNFTIRPVREVADVVDPAAPAKPEKVETQDRIFGLVDSDGDDRVSLAELEAMIRGKFAGAIAAGQAMAMLDLDRDGSLSNAEFSKLLAMPVVTRAFGTSKTTETEDVDALPLDIRGADTDHDGLLGTPELKAALERVDASLGRWAEKIVADADRGGDATKLGAAEVRAARADNQSPDEPSADRTKTPVKRPPERANKR